MRRSGRVSEVFLAFLRLGVTSFGGPVAHLGYFRDDLVVRRKWMDDRAYADLVALCQFLPGPASSQVGFAMGLHRAGASERWPLSSPSPCPRPSFSSRSPGERRCSADRSPGA